ncbi:MAG: tRNA threonylcarbamoyladenosine dehydratase [Treponema sp.]|jgi:tRNA A37 threonylcarbamoyladenosine dehydratase|nr:tRNA threonylcarbamoyladenosine dehydratase [Treponema sp.]
MNPLFQRLALMVGSEAIDTLERSRVIVFGVGGVGSWSAEALARSGVGHIAIVDSDTVCVTNINRQAQAMPSTIGKPKVEALRDRLLAINPNCSVTVFEQVFSKENVELFNMESADYVIDAIDSLTYKLDLIETCFQKRVKIFSSMGMAQKLDPVQLKTADIWDTHGCPLARLVRHGLRKRGFDGHFTVVFSGERIPIHSDTPVACGKARCLCPARKRGAGSGACGQDMPEWCASKKVINGSSVTVTASAGMILAGLVVQDVYAKAGSREEP